jgi:hypothetical protein
MLQDSLDGFVGLDNHELPTANDLSTGLRTLGSGHADR